MRIEPVNPHLGVRVSDLDLARLSGSDVDRLLDLVGKHLVLIFTGQGLDPGQFRDFAERLGEPEPSSRSAPMQPTLGGKLASVNYLEIAPADPRGNFADQWHTDVSYFERPSHLVVLQPQILPKLGGDTLWSSMHAAYDALPASIRSVIDGLSAVHVVNFPDGVAEAVHPVVRVNPITGRRGIYVTRPFTKRIVGLSPNESTHLLNLMFDHVMSPEFQIRHSWSADHVVVWDNRFTQHYAVRDYSEQRRMLRMATVGERPIGIGAQAGTSIGHARQGHRS